MGVLSSVISEVPFNPEQIQMQQNSITTPLLPPSPSPQAVTRLVSDKDTQYKLDKTALVP